MFGLLKRAKKAQEEQAKKDDKVSSRLPKIAIPTRYVVCFKPNAEALTFEASVAIDLTIEDSLKSMFLHSVDLVITKVIWEESDTLNRQEPSEIKTLEKGQIELKFDPFLIPQNGQLRLNFKGNINEKKVTGFYRSKNSHLDSDYNLVAQFEPTDARKFMPSWDSPDFKSEFDICLIVPKGFTAISNMPIKVRYNHKRNPELEIIEFKKTPPIPTYSLAFTVGKFSSIESSSGSGSEKIPLTMFTPPGKQEQGRFALEIGSQAIAFFREYFKCEFPLQKLDFVAVNDLTFESTDAWGMIMFQEHYILVEKEEHASPYDLEKVALLMCEEIAKQWIGNLITIEWWSQLWVKSGLGACLRYLCMEELRPDFETVSHFVREMTQVAMRIDCFKASHSLDSAVYTSTDSEECFDDIGHKKGATLFRMLYHYVGEQHFKEGIALCIEKYKFKNFSPEQLWKCFEEVSSKPVERVMSSWVSLKGFPIIRVSGKQEGKTRHLKVSQEKFVLDQIGRDARVEGTWTVPVTITTEKDPGAVVHQFQLEQKTAVIVVPDVAKGDWLKLNAGNVGYYRVKYATEMFTALVHGIRSKTLKPVDRLNILDDQFALLQAGQLTTIEILTLTEAFLEDDDYNVWCTISHIFNKLLIMMSYMNLDHSVRHFGRYLYARILERLSNKNAQEISNSHHVKLLMGLVYKMNVKFKHPEVLAKCKTLYEQWSNVGEEIPPYLRFPVYLSVFQKNEEESVRVFLKQYRETSSIEERQTIAHACCVITDSYLCRHIMDFAMSDEVRKTDTIDFLSALSKTKAGRDHVWAYFKENFTTFRSRYGSYLGSRLVRGILEDFATEDKAVEITEYFKVNAFQGTDKAVQTAVESIRANETWIKRERNPAALQEYMDADAL